jgi:hypothetical protein
MHLVVALDSLDYKKCYKPKNIWKPMTYGFHSHDINLPNNQHLHA